MGKDKVKKYDARRQGVPALVVKNPRAKQIILPAPGQCRMEGEPSGDLTGFIVVSAAIIAAFALGVHLLVYLLS
jgi:hypothetical protein